MAFSLEALPLPFPPMARAEHFSSEMNDGLQSRRGRSDRQCRGVKCSTFSTRRKFPADEVVALASTPQRGVEVSYATQRLSQRHSKLRFSDVDICLKCRRAARCRRNGRRKSARRRRVVIDNSSAWRMDPGRAADRARGQRGCGLGFVKKNIIANPNCSNAPQLRGGAEAAA